MYKCLDSVNRDNGNIVLIFSEQILIRFDIDLFQNKSIAATCAQDCLFRFIAKMASGSRINDDVRFRHRYFLPANQEIMYKYCRRPY